MFRKFFSIFIALFTASGAVAGQPVFTPLDANTQPTGISGDGSIVVGSYYPNGSGGFYWTTQTGVVPIGGLSVAGISADGSTIVGVIYDDATPPLQNAGYWRWDGTWTLLGSFTPESQPCDRFLSAGYGVNRDGSVIVGLGYDTCSHAHGFRLDPYCMLDLGSIVSTRASRANAVSADGQTIVGWSDQATGFRQGARWVDGAWQWFEGPYGAVQEAFAVNADGSIIVGYGCGSDNQFAWRWTQETGVQCVEGTIAEPYQTLMVALSDDGRVIGGAVAPEFGPSRNALLWFDGAPVDLRDYLLGQGVPEVQDWHLSQVSAVSSDGQTIAGWGIGPDQLVHGFVVTLPYQGRTIVVQLNGVVSSASVPFGVWAGAQAGDPASITLTVPAQGDVIVPDHVESYGMQPNSFIMAVNEIPVGLNPLARDPGVVISNDYPVADALLLQPDNLPLLEPGYVLQFEVHDSTGTAWPSPTLARILGTYAAASFDDREWFVDVGTGGLTIALSELIVSSPKGLQAPGEVLSWRRR